MNAVVGNLSCCGAHASVPVLASSLISSWERMQRRISEESGVSGSRLSNMPSRESSLASPRSLREYAFTRLVFSRSPAMARSSEIPRELPISRRFREPRTSFTLPKEMFPFWKRRVRASLCLESAYGGFHKHLQMGEGVWHRSFPIGEEAFSVSWSMIL